MFRASDGFVIGDVRRTFVMRVFQLMMFTFFFELFDFSFQESVLIGFFDDMRQIESAIFDEMSRASELFHAMFHFTVSHISFAHLFQMFPMFFVESTNMLFVILFVFIQFGLSRYFLTGHQKRVTISDGVAVSATEFLSFSFSVLIIIGWIIVPTGQKTECIAFQFGMSGNIDRNVRIGAVAVNSDGDTETGGDDQTSWIAVFEVDEIFAMTFDFRKSMRNRDWFTVDRDNESLIDGCDDLNILSPIVDDEIQSVQSGRRATLPRVIRLDDFEFGHGLARCFGFQDVVFLQSLVTEQGTVPGPTMGIAPTTAVGAFQRTNAFLLFIGAFGATCGTDQFATVRFLAVSFASGVAVGFLAKTALGQFRFADGAYNTRSRAIGGHRALRIDLNQNGADGDQSQN